MVGTYYVDGASGSDRNDGKSLATAFEHIQACASVLQAGESCLIRAGVYGETVVPTRSGVSNEPIVYSAYGSDTVIVSGVDPVSSPWQDGGQPGVAMITGVDVDAGTGLGFGEQLFAADQGLQSGALIQMFIAARWPNPIATDAGPPSPFDLQHLPESTVSAEQDNASAVEANSSLTLSGTLTDGALSALGTNALVGAGVRFRAGNAWCAQYGKVTANSGSTLSYQLNSPGSDESLPYLQIQPGSNYYVFGLRGLLDAPWEWFYDSAAQRVYVRDPFADGVSKHHLYIRTRLNGFDLASQPISWVTIEGLQFFAANVVTSSSSSHVILDHLSVSYPSHVDAVVTDLGGIPTYGAGTSLDPTGIQLVGSDETLSNSTVRMSAGNLVVVAGKSNTIENNLIEWGDYAATYAGPLRIESGSNHEIRNNTIRYAGRDVIHFSNYDGDNSGIDISYNDVGYAGFLNFDLGTLYACCGDYGNTQVHHNWFHDILPTSSGSQAVLAGGIEVTESANSHKSGPDSSGHSYAAVTGNTIYFDNGTSNIVAHHNVTWASGLSGLYFNGDPNPSASDYGSDSQVHFYNNTVGPGQQDSTAANFCSISSGGTSHGSCSDDSFINNIFTQSPTASWATYTSNLDPPVDLTSVFVGPTDAGPGFQLAPGSAAAGKGTVISGFTTTNPPDLGGYEGGAWTAGCTLPGC